MKAPRSLPLPFFFLLLPILTGCLGTGTPKKDQVDADRWYRQAFDHQRNGDPELAENRLLRALASHPEHYLAMEASGYAALARGDLAQARGHFHGALARHGPRYSISWGLALVRWRSRQWERARPHLAYLSRQLPWWETPALALALASERLGNRNAAREQLERLVARSSAPSALLLDLARLQARADERAFLLLLASGALPPLPRSLARDPYPALRCWSHLAPLLADAPLLVLPRLARQLETAVSRYPGFLPLRLQQAYLLNRQRSWFRAEAAARAALRVWPWSFLAWHELSRARFSLPDPAAALGYSALGYFCEGRQDTCRDLLRQRRLGLERDGRRDPLPDLEEYLVRRFSRRMTRHPLLWNLLEPSALEGLGQK